MPTPPRERGAKARTIGMRDFLDNFGEEAEEDEGTSENGSPAQARVAEPPASVVLGGVLHKRKGSCTEPQVLEIRSDAKRSDSDEWPWTQQFSHQKSIRCKDHCKRCLRGVCEET